MPRWRDYVEPDHEPVSLVARTEPEPEPDVPHALGVLFGAQVGWSPDREAQRPGRCRICGDGRLRPDGREDTLIPPDSRLVCMGCGRYGLDDQVRGLLAITPPKPRRKAYRPPAPKAARIPKRHA